jgi:hypothetical protein
MSPSGVGVTEKSQLPIVVGDELGRDASSVWRGGLPVVSFAAERPQPVCDPCISAAPRIAASAAFAGAFFGCLATLHLSAFGVVPEIASALVTTLLGGHLLVVRPTDPLARAFVPAVYGGGFGGMTSLLWLSGTEPEHSALSVVALSILLSIVCGLAFGIVAVFDAYAGRRLTHGYGGRSGVIATVACVSFVQLVALYGVDNHLFHTLHADLADVNLDSLVSLMAGCLAGTGITLLVLRRQRVAAADLADKTFVASAIALLGLLVVHRMNPTDALLLEGYYAGCFLGMSSRERLDGWIETILGAVILTGLIVQVRLFLPGIGGGLGLAAFATVAALVALKQFMRFVLPISRRETMVTELPTVRGRFTHGVVNPIEKPTRPWGDTSLRPATVIASFALAIALIGGLIWPLQLASKKTAAVATAPVSAGDKTTPDLAVPQPQVQTSAVEATPPERDVTVELRPGFISPSDSKPSDNTTRDNSPSATPSDSGAESMAGSRSASAARDDQPASVEAPQSAEASGPQAKTTEPNTLGPNSTEPNAMEAKTTELTSAVPTISPPIGSVMSAAHETALDETQKNNDSIAGDALFREFLKWRAARVSAASPPARPSAARSHHHVLPPSAVPAATTPQPRSTRLFSVAQTTPTASAVAHPRKPHQGNTATEQAAPAPATFSARPF